MNQDYTPAAIHANSSVEAAVLGAMLLSKTFAQDAAEELVPADFATPAHRIVFSAIQKLLGGRLAVDGVTVAEQLREDGHLKDVGGAPFIHALVEGAPAPDQAERLLEIVRRTAVLRGDRQESPSPLSAREILVDALPEIERQHEEHQDISGVPTGLSELPRRNLDSGLAGGRLSRSGTVRISSYFRTL